jgi:hypothetical protein
MPNYNSTGKKIVEYVDQLMALHGAITKERTMQNCDNFNHVLQEAERYILRNMGGEANMAYLGVSFIDFTCTACCRQRSASKDGMAKAFTIAGLGAKGCQDIGQRLKMYKEEILPDIPRLLQK